MCREHYRGVPERSARHDRNDSLCDGTPQSTYLRDLRFQGRNHLGHGGHESPQVLVIKDGISVFDTSHNAISVEAIKSAL